MAQMNPYSYGIYSFLLFFSICSYAKECPDNSYYDRNLNDCNPCYSDIKNLTKLCISTDQETRDNCFSACKPKKPGLKVNTTFQKHPNGEGRGSNDTYSNYKVVHDTESSDGQKKVMIVVISVLSLAVLALLITLVVLWKKYLQARRHVNEYNLNENERVQEAGENSDEDG